MLDSAKGTNNVMVIRGVIFHRARSKGDDLIDIAKERVADKNINESSFILASRGKTVKYKLYIFMLIIILLWKFIYHASRLS